MTHDTSTAIRHYSQSQHPFQIQGVGGMIYCAPKCTAFHPCPSDLPAGVTAAPQCALKTPDGNTCELFYWGCWDVVFLLTLVCFLSYTNAYTSYRFPDMSTKFRTNVTSMTNHKCSPLSHILRLFPMPAMIDCALICSPDSDSGEGMLRASNAVGAGSGECGAATCQSIGGAGICTYSE